jgi:hypothetical protein
MALMARNTSSGSTSVRMEPAADAASSSAVRAPDNSVRALANRPESEATIDCRASVMAANWSITDRGDPEATGPAILELVDADEPPLRIFFGKGPLDLIREEYAQRIDTWEKWNALSEAAHRVSKRQ